MSLDHGKPLIQYHAVMTSVLIASFTHAAMDCIPRTISRAQTFDSLSSMANIAGYRCDLPGFHVLWAHSPSRVGLIGQLPSHVRDPTCCC